MKSAHWAASAVPVLRGIALRGIALRGIALRGIALGLFLAAGAQAQESVPPDASPAGDNPHEKIEALEQRIVELEKLRRLDQEELEERIDDIEFERDSASGPGWLQRFNQFNPQLTIFGNFVGRIDDQTARNDEGDAVDDRFNLREVEADFRAAIDPWADGVAVLAFEAEAPGEYEAEIEEGYVVLKRIPGLEENPLGVRLTAGRFRQRIGRQNLLHTHDLPQTNRPRSQQVFLGEEGFISDGVMLEFNVPTPGDSNSLDATIAVVNGGELPAGEDNGGEDPALTGRVAWFVEPATDHEFEIGGSWYVGRADAGGSNAVQILAADATYFWRPDIGGNRRSFLVTSEFFYGDIEQDSGRSATPVGGSVLGQVQLTQNLYVNGRYDYTEELLDESTETRTTSVYASYYTTEFLRLRAGYERIHSDDPALDGLDTFFVEFNFVFGSHPAEPYWANR